MELRPFGPLDVEVPVIGLGTWQMELGDREQAIVAIRRAIDRGMSHVDTAESYGEGAVEEIVGEAIAGYRAEVFLASKVHPDHATYAGTLRACEKSLRRLRTDRIDLYMLHWRGIQPLEETFRAFQALERDGKIRAWGVSNFDATDLEHAIGLVGEGVIACNQVLYHLEERDADHVLSVFCERHRIAFVAYSPLGSAGGFPAPDSRGGRALASIAEAHHVTPRAVALRFLARRPSTFVIPKSTSLGHIDALAEAGALALTDAEIATLDEAFPLAPPRSSLPVI